MARNQHDDTASCEYEMVRLAIRGATMTVVIQCKYHNTTFATTAPAANQTNEDGQLLIDEFDYLEGRDLAAQGFDGLQRKPDRESFDENYGDYIAENMPAIITRLKADNFPGLRREDGGQGSTDETLREAIRLEQIIGRDGVDAILGDGGARMKQSVVRVTAVVTADYPRGIINLNIDGEDRGDIPVIATVVDSAGVSRAIGGAILGKMVDASLDAGGIDAKETMNAMRAAAMIKQLTQGDLPTEMDWPELS
jgi:hypothetical protein